MLVGAAPRPHRPREPPPPAPLRRALAERDLAGRHLPQWQYEVTGAARVWYCPDAETKTVWVTHAAPDHP